MYSSWFVAIPILSAAFVTLRADNWLYFLIMMSEWNTTDAWFGQQRFLRFQAEERSGFASAEGGDPVRSSPIFPPHVVLVECLAGRRI